MAQESSASQEAPGKSDRKTHITLHILSPSPEIPERLSLTHAPTSLTIGELRRRITDLTPSKLPPERQRLIYQGRPLQNDALTLDEIDAHDTLTLHLAVPPSSTVPSSASNPPSAPGSHAGITTANHPNIGVPPSVNGQPQAQQPLGIPTNGGHPLPTAQFQGRITFPPGQVPPQLQDVINSHLQQVINQQMGAQIPALMANHAQAIAQAGQSQGPNINHAASANMSWQQLQAQQQRARAAAGQNGIRGEALVPSDGSSDSPPPNPQAPSAQNQSPVPQLLPQHQHPPHHHHQHHHHHPGPQVNQPAIQRANTPNGENFRMIIQSTSTVTSPGFIPPSGIPSPFPPPQPAAVPTIPPPPPIFRGSTPPQNPPSLRYASPWLQQSAPALYLRFQQQFALLNGMISNGQAPSQQQIDSARASLAALPSTDRFGTQGLQLQLDRIASDAQAIRNNAISAASRNTSQQAQAADSSDRETPATTSSAPNTVYMLSSPSGPQALLMTSTGDLFSTSQPSFAPAWRANPFATNPASQSIRALESNGNASSPSSAHSSSSTGLNNGMSPVNGQPPNQIQRQHRHHHHHHNHNHNHDRVQAPQAAANPIQDLLRLLVPLGGHAWLLVRLLGFMYFFTAGIGLRRTLLLGIGGLVLFILQTGALRPWVMHIWDPVRRHIEGLLPVPAVPQPQGAAAAAAPEAQRGPGNTPGTSTATGAAQATVQNSTVTTRASVTPDPAETAARLLADRQTPYLALARDYARRVERGVALFVGSLVPGFGERHIEARNVAEAAIAAAAAEVQRRAEEEREAMSRSEGDGSATQNDGDGIGGNGDGEQGGIDEHQQQQQQQQQDNEQLPHAVLAEEGLRRRPAAANV